MFSLACWNPGIRCLLVFVFLPILSFSQSPTVVSKVVGSGRYIAFYKDETLKRNEKGEVVSGTCVGSNVFTPQGTQLNIAFKNGAFIEFNRLGQVVKGTIAADYNFKGKDGIFKTFFSGDEVAFDAKGQVVQKSDLKAIEPLGKVCEYNNIPSYCNSVQTFPKQGGGYIVTSGVIAKSNITFFPCGNGGVKAKKNTRVEFFAGCSWNAAVGAGREQAEEEAKLCKCLTGSITRVTIDGTHRFFMYGSAHEIEFPDGTEIEFYGVVMKPAIFWTFYNYVYSAKLGRDCYIPNLGLVKKGKTITSVHSFKEGLQTSQGYLKVE